MSTPFDQWTSDAMRLANSWVVSKGTWIFKKWAAKKVGGAYDIDNLPKATNDNERISTPDRC